MGNPTNYRRITNCMNTLIISRVTCNCYLINSCGEDIVKYPRFEHKTLKHYSVSEVKEKKLFVVKLDFKDGNSICLDIPVMSETFSYSAWEFGFQWNEGDDRRSVSFSLDTKTSNWDDFNKNS